MGVWASFIVVKHAAASYTDACKFANRPAAVSMLCECISHY